MLATARSGLPLKFVAQAGGIAYDVFLDWRGRDPAFDRAIEEARLASVQERWEQIMKLGKGTEEKLGDWKALAWSLERTEASSFARPEVQLNLVHQNNATVNALSITIAPQAIREIEAVAEPVRASVRQMFDRYKPNHGKGEEETNGSVSKAVQEKFANYRPTPGNGTGHSAGSQVLSVDNGAAQPVITCHDGDEN